MHHLYIPKRLTPQDSPVFLYHAHHPTTSHISFQNIFPTFQNPRLVCSWLIAVCSLPMLHVQQPFWKVCWPPKHLYHEASDLTSLTSQWVGYGGGDECWERPPRERLVAPIISGKLGDFLGFGQFPLFFSGKSAFFG